MMKNLKLRILYAWPNIIRKNKKQKVGWVGHMVGKRQKKYLGVFNGKSMKRARLKEVGVDDSKLKHILKKQNGSRLRIRLIWFY